MAHVREVDEPENTLERLKNLVLEQLKPDSGFSAEEAYYGVVDLLVTWEVADALGSALSIQEANSENITGQFDGFAFGFARRSVDGPAGNEAAQLLVIARDLEGAWRIARRFLGATMHLQESGPHILARARAQGISDNDGRVASDMD